MNKLKKSLYSLFLISLLLLATALTWLYSKVDGALPLLEGKKTVFGLNKSVAIERDIQGIVTLKAQNRNDIAVALGFVHAQERFFQMDLLRRNSAGELASLFGSVALDYDKSIRKHRFRDRARKIVEQLPPAQFSLLKAYTRGVNQGLKFLRTSPFEYLLLQQEPLQWSEEDSILTIFSMYIDLQNHEGKRERTLGLMKAVLSADVFAFLNPKGSIWDAAIDDTEFNASPMPTKAWPSASASVTNLTDNNHSDSTASEKYLGDYLPGSNSWAISGQLSTTGSAVIANDMHLGIRVPNTWFRASFEYPHEDKKIKVTGATLPGTPNMVIGSNSNIAWGFTNSYGDFSDVVVLNTSENQKQYLTPKGYLNFTRHKQLIAIKGQEAQEIEVLETIWGPVIGQDHQGNLLAYRWVAHDEEAINMVATELEQALHIEQGFDIAARSGIPSQNILIADSQGNIGWTIMGPIPDKKGAVGDTPQSWSSGEHGWQGYLSPYQYPKVHNPVKNRLWTGNSRVVGGDMFKKLGNGGYALGARSKQIKENLLNLKAFNEQSLFDIGLDDKATFLKRWQDFLLEKVLTTELITEHSRFKDVKTLLESPTYLRASIDSINYRLVRNFRINVRNSVFSNLANSLEKIDDAFSLRSIRHQIEVPLWQLINEQPNNYLMLGETSWQALFIKALNETLDDMTQNQELTAATWGQQNSSEINHPLSKAVPFLGHFLDMPSKPLAGDSYMPRVQGKSFGASQRMVVSPGFEENGIFHMPTSQSGHPWSPYYGMGHTDWEQGIASPFLPGKTKYTLTLLSY
jgi:penicillin amidase